MIWIILIRWIIFVTFLLLLVEGIVAIFWLRWFVGFYTRRHEEVKIRLEVVERRLKIE